MSEPTETRNFVLLATALTLCASAIASLATVWVYSYEADSTRTISSHTQIFDGNYASDLARMDVQKLQVRKVQKIGGDTEFYLTVYRKDKTTDYRGAYPDAMDMEIDITPDGVARANYPSGSVQSGSAEYAKHVSKFFLVKGAEVARRIETFDGKILAGSQ